MEPRLTLPAQSASLSRIHETSAKFQRYKALLRRRWWFLLLTASIGMCAQAVRIMGKPLEFKSIARMVAGGRVVDPGSPIVWQEQLQDFYGTIIETIESDALRSQAVNRMRNLHPDMKESEVSIRVLQNRGSAIFNVIATGSEMDYTQKFLNALVDEFVAQRAKVREQALGRVLTTFADGVLRREKAYQEAAERLEAFRKANDIISLTSGHNVAASALTRLNAERDQMRNQLVELDLALNDVGAAMQKRERGVTSAPGPGTPDSAPVPPNSESPQGNPDMGRGGSSGGMTRTEVQYLSVKHEMLSLRVEQERLLKLFKPQHPDVQEVAERISKSDSLLRLLEDEILTELKQSQADLERQIQAKESSIAEKRTEALELAAKIAQDNRLHSDAEAKRQAYEAWFERASELNQLTANMTDYVAIQESASLAVEADNDLLVPLLIGLILGVGAGAVVLLLFDRLDDRMNSFSEFAAIFPNEAVLGQVPEQKQSGDFPLLRPSDERHLYAEAFRNIRSSILFKNWQGHPPKTILVTSAVPNEGKTTVTCNLAITMALSGARILLADCDLRRGGVSELFGLPVSPGLSDVLKGSLNWRDAVLETGTQNLSILPRGEIYDQTSEMLLSKHAETLLREMAEGYDYVIFDSAPVLVADDTASFAPLLDTVLFVVRLSSTYARLTGKALDLLYDRQVNVGGVVLNRSSASLKEYTYYNYASYYYSPKGQAANHPPVAQT